VLGAPNYGSANQAISLFHASTVMQHVFTWIIEVEIIKTEHWGYVLLYDRYGSTNQANSASYPQWDGE